MIKFPKHECSLCLEHNKHKDYYETVSQHLTREGDEDFYDFESPEDKQVCIDTNELWTLQWYPNTPIGFNAVAASTLEKLLAFANKEDSK